MGSLSCVMVDGLFIRVTRDNWTLCYVVMQGASPGLPHVNGRERGGEEEDM